jgi:DNA-binding transcriptional MerR regulator
MSIDTLKVARRLREAGFTEPQAEAVVDAVRESDENSDVATKHDLALLGTELRAEIAALRAEMREMEQRLAVQIEKASAALMQRTVGLVFGAVLLNVVAILGAVFAGRLAH